MKLTIITNTDPYWSRIATLINGEQGDVSGTYETDGNKFHSAVFPQYGGEFSWIPAEFCEVVETPEEPAP